MPQDRVIISLNGPMTVTGASADVTRPKSAKARAVLALLVTAQNGERGRLWLQNMLWSDRGEDQSRQSLRQALTDIRKHLGAARDCLVSDKQNVSLDMRCVERDLNAKGDFLEGLSVKDPAFLEWLEEQRALERHAMGRENSASSKELLRARPVAPATAQVSDPARLFFQIAESSDPSMSFFSTLYVDGLCLTLRETHLVETRRWSADARPGRNDLLASVHAMQTNDGRALLRLSLESLPDREHIWSGHDYAKMDGAPPVHDLALLALGNQLIQALSDRLHPLLTVQPQLRDAQLIGQRAVRKIFTMDPLQIAESDQLLAQAHELDPTGLFLAWRAQLRLIQVVERHDVDAQVLREEIEAFSARALEAEAQNSMILAIAATTRLFLDRDAEGSLALARRSVQINGANPLGWDSLSAALLYLDEPEKAHLSAAKAQILGRGSPYEFWWDMGRSLTALITDRASEANSLLSKSSAFSPNFRASLRFLAGVKAANEDIEGAIRVADRLKALEPDFSFERLVKDETYPTGVFRQQSKDVQDRILRMSDELDD